MSAVFPDPPTVYVLAGCNGAGKTTFAKRYLPEFVNCPTFLNADLIAAELDPTRPESQNLRAGRMFLQQIRDQSAKGETFGFETTLSGRTYRRLLVDLKNRGYRLCLFFLWLPSVNMAVSRVANRVSQGGHNIPPEDIRRRYTAGLRNLFGLYSSQFDAWFLYNSSQSPPELIAWAEEGRFEVREPNLYARVRILAQVFDEFRDHEILGDAASGKG